MSSWHLLKSSSVYILFLKYLMSEAFLLVLKIGQGNSLAVQWLGLGAFRLILSWGTKITQAMGWRTPPHREKKKTSPIR